LIRLRFVSTGWLHRALTAIAGALLLVLGAQSPAQAQSPVCLQLVNELAAIDSGGGFGQVSPDLGKYDRAVRDQRAQIQKTRRAARQNGCGIGGLFQRPTPICDRIRVSLQQMETNLASLERTRNQILRGGRGDERRRNQVVREMRRNGCDLRGNQSQIARSDNQPRRRTLLEQIFGMRTLSDDGGRGAIDINPNDPYAGKYGGTFRTLCVRSCDGYYFPVSFSTRRERFEEDAQACQALCPGQDVELYFHAMPGQDSEDMISYRTDRPYSDLPAAFSYRKEVNPDCTCKFARASFTEIAGSGGFQEVQRSLATQDDAERPVGKPSFRPDRNLDPETFANLEHGFSRESVERLVGAREPETALRNTVSGQRRVRIVGPTFFPVQ
jgi:hypothetical protein